MGDAASGGSGGGEPIMKKFQWKPKKEAWEFAFSNVFPVGPSTLPRPQLFDFDYNSEQERLIQGAAAILAYCGDFGVKIVTSTWKAEPTVVFEDKPIGERVLCVKWNHVVPELLAYGTDKGLVRVVKMNKNHEFRVVHTFTVDEEGDPAQVLSLSWDDSATYLLASLSCDKVGVIHKKTRTRWNVLDPIIISDNPSVRSTVICSAELSSTFFVLAPSYSSTLQLWSRINEVLPTGEVSVQWRKISSRKTGVVVTTMCAFFFQKRSLIATAGRSRTIDIWQIVRENKHTPKNARLVPLVSYTLSASRGSYIQKMTWIRGSLGVSCSDGFIYHLKVHRLPKKIKGELSYFTCKEQCKLNQECGYTTTCLQFDPKEAFQQEYLTSGGTHGFVYIWHLYKVPYLLALEERNREWEINYYSRSNAPTDEEEDDTEEEDDIGEDGTLNRIRQGLKNHLLPEYEDMEKSLSQAKDSWAAAHNHLKDLLENPSSTARELKDALAQLVQIRKDVEAAAAKAKVAYEGSN